MIYVSELTEATVSARVFVHFDILFAVEWRTLKAMLTAIVLNCLRMFPGCFVFITYAGRTLGQTGVEVDPYKIAIMFGVIEMVASLTAIRLADKFNRKTFMITGLSIAASGHWAIATCSYLREVGYDVSSFDWMSIVCMSIIIFIAALCSPVTTVTSVEVLPAKVRLRQWFRECITKMEYFYRRGRLASQ